VRLMVELAASAGLRCCEIAVVHTDDVSQEADGWVLQVHGKGAKVRVIPVMTELATALLRGGRGYVFPGDIEGHLSSGYVSKLVSRSLPGGWTAHTLRHRFASTAYSVDSDLRAVQELLGHASIATTQIYVKVPDDAKRRAVVGAGAIAFGVAA
jgi:integrase/recombinase XerC